MTYREQIQALIAVIDVAYDLAEGIRDAAQGWEKEPFNQCRRLTSEAMQNLKRLDNKLDDNRADMQLSDRMKTYIKKQLNPYIDDLL
jgi:hypothetical protein